LRAISGGTDNWREHLEQDISFSDGIANGTHFQFFDPALNPRVNVAGEVFVITYKTNRLDCLRYIRNLRNCSAYADCVDFCGRQHHF